MKPLFSRGHGWAAAFGVLVLGSTFAAAGCGDSSDAQARAGAVEGLPVTTTLSSSQQRELAELQARLDEVKGLDAAGFAAKYALPFVDDLGYDPLTATGLGLVQASRLGLDDAEKVILASKGFVISERRRFPTFVYGYQTIYSEDLPVYVSADSILYAVHESFDEILKTIEESSLIPALDRMLASMRSALEGGAGSDLPLAARRDVDLYLTVASSLSRGALLPTVIGGGDADARQLFAGATAGSGTKTVTLFGVPRNVDFSQLKPRGHYTQSKELERYFRAMMWLGRIDLRMIETQPDHSQLFHRRQLEGAFVMRAALDAAAITNWSRIDSTLQAFMGEADNMTVPQLDSLLTDLDLASAGGLATRSDAVIAQAIVDGGYGTQRIASHIMYNGLDQGTMPLSSTFLLLGQRYVLDSHVFSNVVYDRVQGGQQKRMMPDPLDVSFAAMKNDQAGLLLGPELTKYSYAPDLASMRILAEAHPPEYWRANLYNEWLSTLRTLSPTADVGAPESVGLPRVAGSEAWGRRLANTQLASWAELRHDTILYAKQSYTTGIECDYPDAYVDPYPDFYAQLAAFATHGVSLAGSVGLSGSAEQAITSYFSQLRTVALTLEAMAMNQRTGAPHSAQHLAFINGMNFSDGCGELSYDGWYAKLFFRPDTAIKLDPIVADVHTQPTDEAGNFVGKVLHVGTGMPRMMVVTVESCAGPRAFVGLASSYFERVTTDLQRLTDEEWSAEIAAKTPADVPWMKDLVAR